MKQAEINRGKNRRAGKAPLQSRPVKSHANETEKRIISLYTSGQSIESITREVGRARHMVVHVLQSAGVFGKNQTGLGDKQLRDDPAEKNMEEPATLELKPDTAAAEMPARTKVEVPADKRPISRNPKAGRTIKSKAAQRPNPASSPAEKPLVSGRWSPMVSDAVEKVILQFNLYPDMSSEEIRKMVSSWNN